MVLVCYDGSPDAKAAIDCAAELLSGRPTTVLSIWEPFADVMARSGASLSFAALPPVNSGEIDVASEQAARGRAQEGVELARLAGLNAQPRTKARGVTIAETILREADELDASAIVIGTRGLTGLKSLLLGSVSHALVQHADRTVVVVPSPDVASSRAAHRR